MMSKKEDRYRVPNRNECKKYVMFCGKVSAVNANNVELDVPKKQFPVMVYLDDFIEGIIVEEGDLVSYHCWILPDGTEGRYAEILKPKNPRRCLIKKHVDKNLDATMIINNNLEETITYDNPLQQSQGSEKASVWKNIFEIAAEKLGKTRNPP